MSTLQRSTLKQFRIFEAAGRHLHFGRAAEELHLTQPAISIQLKQLEQDVGLPLFEQLGRRMHLTVAGRELLDHVNAVLARLKDAEQWLRAAAGADGGELHIASTTTAEYFVPRLLAEFRRARPGLTVRLSVKNREAVVRELTENAVDLAIMGRPPTDLDAIAVAFAPHPMAFIAPPDHRLAGKGAIRLDALAWDPFLVRERDSGTRTAMERVFAGTTFKPVETIEIGSNETIKQAVMAGMGVSFLSMHTIGLELATRRLVVLPVAGTPVMRDWYVIHRERKRLTPAALAFKEFLIACGAAKIEAAIR